METAYDLSNGRDTTVIYFVESSPSFYPAHKGGYIWYPEIEREIQVATRWHRSREDANIELADMMLRNGYQKPLWWQFWRWKEKKLSPELLAML